MFKKYMCLVLCLLMALGTMSTTASAATLTDGLSASYVTFTGAEGAQLADLPETASDVTASVSVTNHSSTASSAVLWVGKFVDDALVDVAYDEQQIGGSQTVPLTATLSNVVKDEATAGDVTYDRTVIKAFVWTAIVGGKAIAAPASLPAEELEVVAVRNNGEVWADFDPDTTEYDIRVTKRDPMPTLEFILNDNSTKVTMPDEFVWGENDVTLTAPNGAEKTYTFNVIDASTENLFEDNFESGVLSSDWSSVPASQHTELLTEDGNTYLSMKSALKTGSSTSVEGFPRLTKNFTATELTDGLSKPIVISGKVRFVEPEGGTKQSLYPEIRKSTTEKTTLFTINRNALSSNSPGIHLNGRGQLGTVPAGTWIDYEAIINIYKDGANYKATTTLTVTGEGLQDMEGEVVPEITGTVTIDLNAGLTAELDANRLPIMFNTSLGTSINDSRLNLDDFVIKYADEVSDEALLGDLTYTVDGTTSDVVDFMPYAPSGEYAINIPDGTTSVTLTPTASMPRFATAIVTDESGVEIPGGVIDLSGLGADDSKTVKIKVTAEDGVTVNNNYTVIISFGEPGLSKNARLSSLTFAQDGGEPVTVPGFDPEVTSYEVELEYKPVASGVLSTATAEVAATTENANATYEIQSEGQPLTGAATVTGLDPATVDVVVKAQDGTQKTYQVKFKLPLFADDFESYKDEDGNTLDQIAVGGRWRAILNDTPNQKLLEENGDTFVSLQANKAIDKDEENGLPALKAQEYPSISPVDVPYSTTPILHLSGEFRLQKNDPDTSVGTPKLQMRTFDGDSANRKTFASFTSTGVSAAGVPVASALPFDEWISYDIYFKYAGENGNACEVTVIVEGNGITGTDGTLTDRASGTGVIDLSAVTMINTPTQITFRYDMNRTTGTAVRENIGLNALHLNNVKIEAVDSVPSEEPTDTPKLASLQVNGTDVSGFNADTKGYRVELPAETTEATVAATAADGDTVAIKVGGQTVADGKVTVSADAPTIVTIEAISAEDESVKTEYTLTLVVQEATDPDENIIFEDDFEGYEGKLDTSKWNKASSYIKYTELVEDGDNTYLSFKTNAGDDQKWPRLEKDNVAIDPTKILYFTGRGSVVDGEGSDTAAFVIELRKQGGQSSDSIKFLNATGSSIRIPGDSQEEDPMRGSVTSGEWFTYKIYVRVTDIGSTDAPKDKLEIIVKLEGDGLKNAEGEPVSELAFQTTVESSLLELSNLKKTKLFVNTSFGVAGGVARTYLDDYVFGYSDTFGDGTEPEPEPEVTEIISDNFNSYTALADLKDKGWGYYTECSELLNANPEGTEKYFALKATQRYNNGKLQDELYPRLTVSNKNFDKTATIHYTGKVMIQDDPDFEYTDSNGAPQTGVTPSFRVDVRGKGSGNKASTVLSIGVNKITLGGGDSAVSFGSVEPGTWCTYDLYWTYGGENGESCTATVTLTGDGLKDALGRPVETLSATKVISNSGAMITTNSVDTYYNTSFPAMDSDARICLDDLVVTSEKNATIPTFSDVATLSELKYTAGQTSADVDGFVAGSAPAEAGYKITVPGGTTAVTINATASDANAKTAVVVNGEVKADNVVSVSNAAPTEAIVYVTAQNNLTVNQYKLEITVGSGEEPVAALQNDNFEGYGDATTISSGENWNGIPKEANQSLEKEGNNTYLSIHSDFAAGQRYPVATKSIDYAEKQILHFSGKLRLQKHASVNPLFKFVTEEDKTIMVEFSPSAIKAGGTAISGAVPTNKWIDYDIYLTYAGENGATSEVMVIAQGDGLRNTDGTIVNRIVGKGTVDLSASTATTDTFEIRYDTFFSKAPASEACEKMDAVHLDDVMIEAVDAVPTGLSNNALLSSLKVDGQDVAGFTAENKTYSMELAAGTKSVKIEPTAADENASVFVKFGNVAKADNVVYVSDEMPTDAVVEVTSEDGTVIEKYTITFTVEGGSTDPNLIFKDDFERYGSDLDELDASFWNAVAAYADKTELVREGGNTYVSLKSVPGQQYPRLERNNVAIDPTKILHFTGKGMVTDGGEGDTASFTIELRKQGGQSSDSVKFLNISSSAFKVVNTGTSAPSYGSATSGEWFTYDIYVRVTDIGTSDAPKDKLEVLVTVTGEGLKDADGAPVEKLEQVAELETDKLGLYDLKVTKLFVNTGFTKQAGDARVSLDDYVFGYSDTFGDEGGTEPEPDENVLFEDNFEGYGDATSIPVEGSQWASHHGDVINQQLLKEGDNTYLKFQPTEEIAEDGDNPAIAKLVDMYLTTPDIDYTDTPVLHFSGKLRNVYDSYTGGSKSTTSISPADDPDATIVTFYGSRITIGDEGSGIRIANKLGKQWINYDVYLKYGGTNGEACEVILVVETDAENNLTDTTGASVMKVLGSGTVDLSSSTLMSTPSDKMAFRYNAPYTKGASDRANIGKVYTAFDDIKIEVVDKMPTLEELGGEQGGEEPEPTTNVNLATLKFTPNMGTETDVDGFTADTAPAAGGYEVEIVSYDPAVATAGTSSVTIAATAVDPTATVAVKVGGEDMTGKDIPLSIFEKTAVDVVVTAEDDTTATYKLNISLPFLKDDFETYTDVGEGEVVTTASTLGNPWFVLPEGHKNENKGVRVTTDGENQYATIFPAGYYNPSGGDKVTNGVLQTQRNPAIPKNLPNYDTEKPIIHVHGKFQITKTEEAPAYGYWKVTIPGDKDPAAQFQLGSVQVGGNKIEGVTLQADAWYTYDFYLEHPGVNSEEVVIDEKKGTKGLVYPLNTMANVYLEISGAGIDGIASGSGQVNMCKTRKKAVLTSTGAFAVRFDHAWGSEFADYGLEENESKWGDSRVNHDDITIEIVDAMPNGGAN